MGISVAVDDFGTGYSNLSYLIDFSFQKLKIDRSFVSRIDTDSNSGAVVSTIVGLSRALGVHTIAEGVETENQATMLQGRRMRGRARLPVRQAGATEDRERGDHAGIQRPAVAASVIERFYFRATKTLKAPSPASARSSANDAARSRS